MLELFDGPLDVEAILARWHAAHREHNHGAFITFVGTVRDEGGIDGLSFDLHPPLLQPWFESWSAKAAAHDARIMMAHSRGDVLLHQCSYIAGISSPKRRAALELIDTFVEDFKASAPIWKYDLEGGVRRYALQRSTALQGSGLLGGGR